MQTHKPPFPTKMFRGPWVEDNAPDPVEADKLAFIVREIQQMVCENNLPPVYILGIDEPNFDSTGAMLERCRRIFEIIQGAGGRTVTAIDIDGSDRLGTTIDMPIHNAYSAYRQLLNPAIKNPGKIELIYWHPLEKPVHDRFHFGLMVWRANLDGACPYAYRHVYQGDPFRREDSRDERKGERNSMYTYPSKTGPIPTIQWEAAREGIDDVRYLQTLKFWTDRAAASGAAGPEAKQAIAEARRILAIGLDATKDYDALLGSLTPAYFDSLRKRVIRSIVRTKALAGH